MKRLCIVCEWAAEVEFVRQCLKPHLDTCGLMTYPSMFRSPSGGHGRGRVSVERLARFVAHESHDTEGMTTLVRDGSRHRGPKDGQSLAA